MSPFLATLVFGTLAGLGNLLGGIIVTAKARRSDQMLTYFVALGGGFMLAAAFLEMVPESLHTNEKWAPALMLSGYLLVLFFEHFLGEHVHLGDHEHHGDEGLLHDTVGASTLIGIGIHTFFDGAAVGAGFHVNNVVGLLIFTAVVLHKIPEGFTVSSILLATGRSRWQALGGSVLIALATLAGALLTGASDRLLPLALPMSAGVMVHVAATDLIPEINEVRGVRVAGLIFVGVALFYVAKLTLEAVGIH
ncbi:MAG: ZIP family magnesium transporter [Armatimonadetes bacterium CG_4_10_14_3_um_filter_66_18]|nr:ZIP family metal transporter [Armatimonadota bacterium]OIP04034.1 MAG: hypothetical protein AUJ96_13735 [Armatimonadetes bacterium CG2_30_66_41]PIU87634.1 MAG: ZIP family magnesium transporter [Armatimonadetes bacterium CG06_land_8_20_14_3_00_66_21]PIX37131.1 MAG: ZIP family magnesium transporter [Armatimonadetes bacterium CG_4_8_14_3_um_filter_66_20]PIY51187.1 MAG: ZIP family magnesium transporter [Armatimonadetes bacterium CG_4_10_14_3_um_filter_66_18]PIZ40486.1 MAG: ZIP family magnesium 